MKQYYCVHILLSSQHQHLLQLVDNIPILSSSSFCQHTEPLFLMNLSNLGIGPIWQWTGLLCLCYVQGSFLFVGCFLYSSRGLWCSSLIHYICRDGCNAWLVCTETIHILWFFRLSRFLCLTCIVPYLGSVGCAAGFLLSFSVVPIVWLCLDIPNTGGSGFLWYYK